MAKTPLKKIIAFYCRFTPSYSAIGYHVRRMFWRRINPDFRGQTWLVTGGSEGIGASAARQAVARIPADIDPALLAILASNSDSSRVEAIRALANRAAVTASPHVLKLSSDPSRSVQSAARQFLRDLAPSRSRSVR